MSVIKRIHQLFPVTNVTPLKFWQGFDLNINLVKNLLDLQAVSFFIIFLAASAYVMEVILFFNYLIPSQKPFENA